MFVFDWFLDWIYGKVMGFIQTFFTYISGMGAEIFELPWIQAVIEFFRLFGWSMYVVALVVAVFDTAIAWQNGQGNIKDAALGAIKGFMAVNLFTVVPIELYKLSIEVQNSLGQAMSGLYSGSLSDLSELSSAQLLPFQSEINPFNLFTIIALGYAVIKVFFANIKRGGIIMTFGDHMLLGLGIMLAANEVPRIADRFGLDTSSKVNIMSTYYATQAAVRTTQAVMKAVSK